MQNEYLEELQEIELSTNERVEAIFHGTCALQELIEKSVLPVLMSTLDRTPQENALLGTYYRMASWSKSLAELNNPIHFQTACSAARSLFELLLDVKELALDPSKAEAFFDFTFVRRFRIAEQKVRYHDDTHGNDPNTYKIERAFITNPANITKCEELRRTHWGVDRNNNLTCIRDVFSSTVA